MLKEVLFLSFREGNTEIVKILVEKEGNDINSKDRVYFNNFGFQNNIWSFFKLFETALILAYEYGHTEIVKILVEQEGIDINAKENEIHFNNCTYKSTEHIFIKKLLTSVILIVLIFSQFRCDHYKMQS